MTHKSKKSMNGTNILALIVGFSALAVAIAALVNNKKDNYTSANDCCVEKCDGGEGDGWCIGKDDDDNLTFNYGKTVVFKINKSSSPFTSDDIVKYTDTLNMLNKDGALLGSTSGYNACPKYHNDCLAGEGLGNNYIAGNYGWFTTWDVGMRGGGADENSHNVTLKKV